MPRKIKEDIIVAISVEKKTSIREVRSFINPFVNHIIKTLEEGKGVYIKGLGEFCVEDSKPRIVTNNFTPDKRPFVVSQSKAIRFYPCNTLSNTIKKRYTIKISDEEPENCYEKFSASVEKVQT